MILPQSVTKIVDKLHFLLGPEQSLDLEPWLLGEWGTGVAGEVSEHQPAQEAAKALGQCAVAQWHTLKGARFKITFVFGWKTLIILSHFTDEELRPKSVKSISLLLSQLVLDRTRTRVQAQPASGFFSPSLRRWCSCWNVRRQMLLLASQLGKLPGFKCQIYFYVTYCVSWTTQHLI